MGELVGLIFVAIHISELNLSSLVFNSFATNKMLLILKGQMVIKLSYFDVGRGNVSET